MPKTIKSIHSRSGEATRPDLTQEQEAEICELTLTQVMMLRQAMERGGWHLGGVGIPGSRHRQETHQDIEEGHGGPIA